MMAEQEEAVKLLNELVPWLEHSMPPAPNHICGPESPCDMDCVEHAHCAELLRRVYRIVYPTGKR